MASVLLCLLQLKVFNGDVLFNNANTNNDDCLSAVEVSSFIRQKQMGDTLDDEEEVAASVDNMFRTMDKDQDDCITIGEMDSYSKRLCRTRLRTPEDVADWLHHAADLPKVASKFLDAGVRCKDFRRLLGNQGQLLVEALNITNPLHMAQARSALSMMLMGLGPIPPPPIVKGSCKVDCNSVAISFKPSGSEAGQWPAHKYTLSRWTGSSKSKRAIVAEVLADDVDMNGGVFEDKSLLCSSTYHYKLHAWNEFGCSEGSLVGLEGCRTHDCAAKSCQKKLAPGSGGGGYYGIDIDGDGTVGQQEFGATIATLVSVGGAMLYMVLAAKAAVDRASERIDEPWNPSVTQKTSHHQQPQHHHQLQHPLQDLHTHPQPIMQQMRSSSSESQLQELRGAALAHAPSDGIGAARSFAPVADGYHAPPLPHPQPAADGGNQRRSFWKTFKQPMLELSKLERQMTDRLIGKTASH